MAIWTLRFLTRRESSGWPQGCGRFSRSALFPASGQHFYSHRGQETFSRTPEQPAGVGGGKVSVRARGRSARGRAQERGRWPDAGRRKKMFARRTIKEPARRRGRGRRRPAGRAVRPPIPLRQAPPPPQRPPAARAAAPAPRRPPPALRLRCCGPRAPAALRRAGRADGPGRGLQRPAPTLTSRGRGTGAARRVGGALGREAGAAPGVNLTLSPSPAAAAEGAPGRGGVRARSASERRGECGRRGPGALLPPGAVGPALHPCRGALGWRRRATLVGKMALVPGLWRAPARGRPSGPVTAGAAGAKVTAWAPRRPRALCAEAASGAPKGACSLPR